MFRRKLVLGVLQAFSHGGVNEQMFPLNKIGDARKWNRKDHRVVCVCTLQVRGEA